MYPPGMALLLVFEHQPNISQLGEPCLVCPGNTNKAKQGPGTLDERAQNGLMERTGCPVGLTKTTC